MTGIYKFGETEITESENFILGSQLPYTVMAPGSIAIKSSSDQDKKIGIGASQIQVVGIRRDGTKHTELVSLNGMEPVTTRAEFIFIEDMKVFSGNTNTGDIQSFDISGEEVVRIKKGENRSNRTIYYAVGEGAVLAYGAGVVGDPNFAGAIATLTIISKKRRNKLHKISVSQFGGINFNHEFRTQPQFKAGDIILVEVETLGLDAVVHGHLELEVE